MSYKHLGSEHSVYISEDLRCKHPVAQIYTRVLSSVVNCETTEAYCGICGEAVEPPKTDCT